MDNSLTMISLMLGAGMIFNAVLVYTLTSVLRDVATNLAAMWIVSKQVYGETKYVADYLREIESYDAKESQKRVTLLGPTGT